MTFPQLVLLIVSALLAGIASNPQLTAAKRFWFVEFAVIVFGLFVYLTVRLAR
jgi:hypothetical protein